MTQEDFKARVSMAYEGREQWEAFLNRVWSIHTSELPHWISVEDELPPIRKGVIAYNGVTSRKAWVLEDGSWIAETHKEWERNCFKQYPVTHWMPMPQAPVLSNSENIGKDEKGGEQ